MSNSVKKFEIHLEHDIDEQYQYFPGELMRGAVVLSSEDPVRVKAILVQIKGEATVSWPSDDQNGDMFSTSETYVDVTLTVFGTDDGGGVDQSTIELPGGDHSYPFEYALPPSLPSSFIGKHGGVTYIIKATLKEDRPGGLGTVITTDPFLVLRPMDIASNRELLQRRTVTASRRTSGLTLLCCLFGKTVGRFSVARTGVLPGDNVIVDADVSNDSSQPIKSIHAAVVLVSTFQAKKLTRSNTQVVVKKADNVEVEYGATHKWTSVQLALPSYIPESRLDGCDMIDIAYEVRFRLEMADGSDVTAAIPITVGTPKRKAVGALAKNGAARRSGNGVARLSTGMLGNGGEGLQRQTESDLEKFRHPMIPGETRKNILFEGNID